MHRLLVTISLLLLPLIAGCAGFTNPLTGTTVGGGVVANTSRLLGTPLPAGMEFYAEHSRIEGQDGMETLRGTASPAGPYALAMPRKPVPSMPLKSRGAWLSSTSCPRQV